MIVMRTVRRAAVMSIRVVDTSSTVRQTAGVRWTPSGKVDAMTTTLRGGCHCGAVKMAFETSIEPSALPLRTCQCSFCRRHGAVTTSDSSGRLRVDVDGPEKLQRYRFALGITDFLVCRFCGVYVAATMDTDGRLLGVLNVNALDEREPFARRQPEPMRYGAETVEDREARRAKTWMPVEVRSSVGTERR
jgi:hypothetical protein